jgi:DNA-binding FadR family transcriptional regulator
MIRRESLHDKVVRHLALQILKGGVTTLPNEADLGKELRVSRSILRESIKVLAAKGLLEVGPKTGTRVRPRKEWNLLDPQLLEWISENGIEEHFFENLSELRSILEPKAAELAALRATESDIQEMQSAFDGMRQSNNDREAYNAADLRLHQAILAASHNELLYQVGGLTQVLLRMSFALTSASWGPFTASLPPHKDVLDAIIGHNPAAARSHMEGIIALATAQIRKAHDYKIHQRPPARNKTPVAVGQD